MNSIDVEGQKWKYLEPQMYQVIAIMFIAITELTKKLNCSDV